MKKAILIALFATPVIQVKAISFLPSNVKALPSKVKFFKKPTDSVLNIYRKNIKRPKKLYANLMELFSTLDTTIINGSSSTGTIGTYLAGKNQEILDYIRWNYCPTDTGTIDDVNSTLFTEYGLAFAFAEKNNFVDYDYSNVPNSTPDDASSKQVTKSTDGINTPLIGNQEMFDCLMDIIGIATGVALLAKMITTAGSGEPAATAWAAAKQLITRSLPWFGVAYGIYRFGRDCMHWW
jgi:hypothetical protein